ncbi:error-prone DNA polymerase [bacterium]|nr:error-prone DNA polymerase [bacterium]
MSGLPDYAELHCVSNFSFLRGASHPGELVERAAKLGYRALALTDECSLAGVVRAHEAAKEHTIQLIIGAEFHLREGPHCVLLATNRRGYGQLASFITLGRRRSVKGQYDLGFDDLLQHDLSDCLLIWRPDGAGSLHAAHCARAAQHFAGRMWLGFTRLSPKGQAKQLAAMQALGAQHDIPLVACGDVHMHARSRRALQDTLTAIRLSKPLQELGYALFPNGERHLRPLTRLGKLYPPAFLQQSCAIAGRCNFSLDSLRYEYPHEIVPDGEKPASWLRKLAMRGAQKRYPQGIAPKVLDLLEKELQLIAELQYAYFFLTVYDIVRWARSQGILCQGRGSAANSAVCYCLGITAVDPSQRDVLIERFISKERNEPPDIDVDFEHERREEVIQHIYQKYGRDRAALAATVISYRTRSAIRDVGKALGMSLDQVDQLARTHQWWDSKTELEERFVEAGLPPDSLMARRLIVLVSQISGFPRHLSQHVGGFVISQGPVHQLCPVENAAMPERTIIQWDKDDLEALNLLKVDVLALGMLTCLRKCFALVKQHTGCQLTLDNVPQGDTATYQMMHKADTVGVFQIESRAQMAMLPRLKPKNLYELSIEVAIVRPGPIQGDMVHPYLARKRGDEPADCIKAELEPALKRTLGVPIFQEQVMQIAMIAAGFSGGEADSIRRAMAAWKRKGGLEPFEAKLKAGMQRNGYPDDFANRIYQQILGFGEYGFPESHAISFALLAYVSSWLKCHHPAAFTTALLNSLPMGFYGPSQIIQDAQRHGITVRPVDVLHSDIASTLEPVSNTQASNKLGSNWAIRLGLDRIKGLANETAARIVAARTQHRFHSVNDLAQRSGLKQEHVEVLAAADALAGLAGNRYSAHWQASGIDAGTGLLSYPSFSEALPLLKSPSEADDVAGDYAATGLTLRQHPLAFFRGHLSAQGAVTADTLKTMPTGQHVRVAGLVIGRQRPGSASGVMFITLEDETGPINLVVWPKLVITQRRALIGTRLIVVDGALQSENGVIHVVADTAHDCSHWIGQLNITSRNFH